MHWAGFSSARRAWGMQGSNKNGVLHTGVAESAREAGSHFLSSTCGALDGLLGMEEYDGIDKFCVFAYDGLHAAILVVEDHTTVFCAQVVAGLYDLGSSSKMPMETRFGWQESLTAAASRLASDDIKCSTKEALVKEELPTKKPPFLATTVHMAPDRVSVHQRCADGATEGSSVQYAIGKQHLENLQDAFIVFNTHSACSERFVQRSAALASCYSTCSEAHVVIPASIIPPRKIRKTKKDPRGPRGYVSDFNFYVKAKRPAYVRDAQEVNRFNITPEGRVAPIHARGKLAVVGGNAGGALRWESATRSYLEDAEC